MYRAGQRHGINPRVFNNLIRSLVATITTIHRSCSKRILENHLRLFHRGKDTQQNKLGLAGLFDKFRLAPRESPLLISSRLILPCSLSYLLSLLASSSLPSVRAQLVRRRRPSLAFVARPLFSSLQLSMNRFVCSVWTCVQKNLHVHVYGRARARAGTLVLERAVHTSTIGGRTWRMRPSLVLKKVPLSPSDLSRRANEASFHRHR